MPSPDALPRGLGTAVLALGLLLSGCAPQDAEIQGQWVAWLADASSPTVAEGDLDLSGAFLLDCTSDPLPGNQADCSTISPEHYDWLVQDAYHILQGELAPWRSEAILTSEGDFQLTFHVDLGNGVDFRAAFVIDPAFHPQECVAGEDGEAHLQEVDGGDWVAEWSSDEDGMFIYYLNAGAFQYNPYDSDDYWDLPQEWLAGFGHAKFGPEEFYSEPSQYGIYDTSEDLAGGSSQMESWYEGVNPDVLEEVQGYAEAWTAELVEQGRALPDFTLKLEDNAWREQDDTASGLDGWVQLDSSWVRVDHRGPYEPGDSVSGDFQIYYDGLESQSHLLLRGSFVVPEIHEDRWGYPDLMEEKREENQTPSCGD